MSFDCMCMCRKAFSECVDCWLVQSRTVPAHHSEFRCHVLDLIGPFSLFLKFLQPSENRPKSTKGALSFFLGCRGSQLHAEVAEAVCQP